MCDALLPVTMYSFLQTMLMCLGTIGIVISVNPWYEKEGGRERGREGEREGGKEGGREGGRLLFIGIHALIFLSTSF